MKLITEETEVLPGLFVYPVGGHCPGELLVRVETGAGSFILASDAAHFYEQIENEWPFFAFTDIEEMKEGLAFINKLAKETDSTIVPGHDGRTRDRFPAAPGVAGEVAIVLA